MDKNGLHAECPGDGTSVLGPGTPEACEHVCRCIVTLPQDKTENHHSKRHAPLSSFVIAQNVCSHTFICVSALIGRHMVSLATVMKPMATCGGEHIMSVQ